MAAFTAKQVSELATVLGQPVPETYLAFLRDYPAELASRRYEGLEDLISDYELLRDPVRVIEENEMVREEDIWTEEGPWPSTHMVIGVDMGGDVVALRLDEPGLPVERLLTEVARFERVAANVREYAEQLLSQDQA